MAENKVKIGATLIRKYRMMTPFELPFQKVIYSLPPLRHKNYLDTVTVILESEPTWHSGSSDRLLLSFTRANVKNPKHVLERWWVDYDPKDLLWELIIANASIKVGVLNLTIETLKPHEEYLKAAGLFGENGLPIRKIHRSEMPKYHALTDASSVEAENVLLKVRDESRDPVDIKGTNYAVQEVVNFTLSYCPKYRGKNSVYPWKFSFDVVPVRWASKEPDQKPEHYEPKAVKNREYRLSQEQMEKMLSELERKMTLWYRDEMEVFRSEIDRAPIIDRPLFVKNLDNIVL